MSVRLRRLKINSKGFYVVGLRRANRALLFSISTNIFLIIAVFIVFLIKKEPDYYATSGETPPIKLTSLAEPNYTSNALLGNEDNENNEDNVERAIPN